MVAAATGIITTVAGPGVYSTLGDGGPATSAYLGNPRGLAFDGAGNLYIVDTYNNSVRMVNAATGIITTVAGGRVGGPLGDGELATDAYIGSPQGITFDNFQNLYIADTGNSRIRKVDKATGIITTIAGNGIPDNTGDGGLATAARITVENGIAVDGAGNVYFSSYPGTIRKVDATTGIITTIAGDGYSGFGGDGGAAIMAELWVPAGLVLDSAGTVYFADAGNYRVRKVTFQPTAAVLISPRPGLGTVLPASNATFEWTTFATATEYQLNLSAIAPGDSDMFLYKGTATSATANTLPANGVSVYARLYSKINGEWQYNDYVYTESGTPTPAALTSPTPGLGTILGTANVAFHWTSGVDVTEYQLNLSAVAAGDSELLLYKGAALTTTAATLPGNGAKLYARLYSKTNGAWQYNDYVYTEGGTPTPATLTSPTPGLSTILGTTSVEFQWTAGIAVTDYQLNLSAVAAGDSDLYLYKGTGLNTTVSSLPAKDVKVYARLYSYINGVWQHNDYVYTESGTPTPAALTSPTPGLSTILGTSTVEFQWTAGVAVSDYQLNLSAIAPGDSELFRYKGTATSATATTLPSNGVKVYARLYSYLNGAWQYNDYVYTEQ
jgi:sugar lactone lactonase YvrE